MGVAVQTEKPVKVREAARFLGMSENWVYRKTEDGTLPARKLGRQWRYFLSELGDFLKKLGEKAES